MVIDFCHNAAKSILFTLENNPSLCKLQRKVKQVTGGFRAVPCRVRDRNVPRTVGCLIEIYHMGRPGAR